MELKDTIEMMNSPDYKERFRAEFYQTRIRYEKLRMMCSKYEADKLDFEPKCSLSLLKDQLNAMDEYLYNLQIRAAIEGIKL